MTRGTRDFMIITGAGLVVGLAEALIYYNMGKAKEKGKFSFGVPPAKELAKVTGVVFLTAVITAGITAGIEKALEPKLVLAT